ncbi:VCBS domain-containing protein [Enhygromyxa salina]|uniref:VCBS domain-containing protein n=1 Tax=Enhygromyxa salina TaxID=215803 RepID=UPI0011BA8A8C|nr:VCBS domain-containing protein [Enhygromyxa salina]
MYHSKRVLQCIIAFSLIAFAERAEAYCVGPLDYASFWSNEFADLRVPVWVSISPIYPVSNTGESPEDVARILLEVIARHNESTRAPKLYFAGFTNESYNPALVPFGVGAHSALPAGITVHGLSCADLVPVCKGDAALACASFGIRGTGPASVFDDPVGFVLLDCAENTPWALDAYPDMAQVLFHELGHALALQHSDRTKAECEAGNNIHGGPVGGTVAVMHTVPPASFVAYRSWRRDDVEGLEYIYGAAAPNYEISWWDDLTYPNYPNEASGSSLRDMGVSRTAVVSNRLTSGTQSIATTATDGRVLNLVLDEFGTESPANIADRVVDPGPEGLAWSLPAVAMSEDDGQERVFVAWMAGEQQDSVMLTLRTAVRGSNSLVWQYSNYSEQVATNRLAAGYDQATDSFVVTTLDRVTTEIQILYFDGDGVSSGEVIPLVG